MRLSILLCAIISAAIGSAAAKDPIEASEAFEQRQRDLVSLAGYLGQLHRLHQVCGDPYNSNLFRNRMKEVVPLESPMGSTRLDMIAAFNEGYREASALYSACDDEVQSIYEKTAERALVVTDRLYAPFR